MTSTPAASPAVRSARRGPSRSASRVTVAVGALALVVGLSPAAHAQSSVGMPALPIPGIAAPGITAPGAPGGFGDISAPAPAPAPAPATEVARMVAEIHTHTNHARTAAGLRPLARAAALDGAAQRWSARMAAEDRMYHNPAAGAEVQAAYGSRWSRSAENVLQNWRGATGEALVRQWMNSPAHRANILAPEFTDLGVGVAVAPSGKLYATQNFVAVR